MVFARDKLNPDISVIESLFYLHNQVDGSILRKTRYFKWYELAIICVCYDSGHEVTAFVKDKSIVRPVT
jgi:hypothetical protein